MKNKTRQDKNKQTNTCYLFLIFAEAFMSIKPEGEGVRVSIECLSLANVELGKE